MSALGSIATLAVVGIIAYVIIRILDRNKDYCDTKGKVVKTDPALCPDGWQVASNGVCYQPKTKYTHPLCGKVNFTKFSDEAKRQWALDNAVPWAKYGVTADMLCPDAPWRLVANGKCITDEGRDPAGPFTGFTDEARRDWCLGNWSTWRRYGITEDVLCPDGYSLNFDSHFCDYPPGTVGQGTRNHAKFDFVRAQWPSNYADWARNNNVVWRKYGVTQDQFCPDGFRFNRDTGTCTAPDGTPANFAGFTDAQKKDWASSYGYTWGTYGIDERALCPDNWKLDSSRRCQQNPPVPDNMKPYQNAVWDTLDARRTSGYPDWLHFPVLQQSWARQYGQVWSAHGITRDVLCPDDWELRSDGYCYKNGVGDLSPAQFGLFTDADKKKWAIDNKQKWARYGVK